MSLETSQMFHWWCGLCSCCWRKLPGCCLTAVPLHHTALGLSIICPYLLGQRPSLYPRIQDGYLGCSQLIFRTVVVVQRLHRCILVLFGSLIARHWVCVPFLLSYAVLESLHTFFRHDLVVKCPCRYCSLFCSLSFSILTPQLRFASPPVLFFPSKLSEKWRWAIRYQSLRWAIGYQSILMQSFFIQSLYPWKKLTPQNERHLAIKLCTYITLFFCVTWTGFKKNYQMPFISLSEAHNNEQ